MLAKTSLRTTGRWHDLATNRALRKSLRRSLAIAISFGLFGHAIESRSLGQYNSGDIPASPWANRTEKDTPSGNIYEGRTASERLRPPGSTSPSSIELEMRSSELEYNDRANRERQRTRQNGTRQTEERSTRDAQSLAPVTLMSPMVPKQPPSNPANSGSERSSIPKSEGMIEFPREARTNEANARGFSFQQQTVSPSHVSTQRRPIDAQSDWQRVKAGGLALENENLLLTENPDFDGPATQNRAAYPSDRRFAMGLPDRVEELPTSPSTSQMASAKSAVGVSAPIFLGDSRRSEASNASSPDRTKLGEATVHEARVDSNANTFVVNNSAQQSHVAAHTEIAKPSPTLVQSIEEVVPKSIGLQAGSSQSITLDQALTTRPKMDEFEIKRIALAQRVSHETSSSPNIPQARAPEALESLPGWQAVERDLKQRLERCDSLLRRGGVLSAREEVYEGLLRLFRVMDLHRGQLYSEPAFEKAITAFREEADFQKIVGGRQGYSVQSIVDTHSTEALKGRPLDATSPEMAAMHYRWYARYQLVAASDGHPWASDLLYAYGKTLEKEAELNASRTIMFRSQAVACYQAAIQITPTQSEAANQLGFALIHLDRMDDAYAALTTSIQTKPNANAWNNLAELYRQRGALAEADYAVKQAAALSSTTPQFGPGNPEITEVDPAVFAQYSPMPTMATPSQNLIPAATPASAPVGNPAYGQVAKPSKNLLSRIFGK